MKVNVGSALKAGAFAALVGAVVNVCLFYIFHATDVITDDIFVQPEQPMTVLPIIFSSVIPAIIGALVFSLIERFSRSGYRIFTIVTIVLLCLSFMNPFMAIENVTVPYALALSLMHVVAVVSLLYFVRIEVKKVAEA